MAYQNPTTNGDIYTRITDRIVAAIETDGGAGKWCMPWHKSASSIMPRNATTGHEYRGVNVVVLWCIAEECGFASGQWATYRQWRAAGAQVRKGEKAAPVVFWKKLDRKGDDDEADDDRSEKKALMVARGYSVFNAAQVDGYELEEAELPGERPLVERLEHAEAFVTNTGATRVNGVDRAFYRPSTDSIHMPPIEAFTGSDTSTPQEAYYGTVLHELTHWTGAEPRCNRQFGKRFGDDAYAAEELVAELGAAFMSAGLGITSEPRADHAKYIGSWLRVMKGDSRAIFTAASKAQAAVAFCEGLQNGETVAEPTPAPEPIVVAEPVAPAPVEPEPIVVFEPKPKRRRKSKRGGVTICTRPIKGKPGKPFAPGERPLFVDGPPTKPYRKKRRVDTRVTTAGKWRDATVAACKKCVHPAPVMLTIFEDGYGVAMSTWQKRGEDLPIDRAILVARGMYRERLGCDAPGVLFCGDVRTVAERPVFKQMPPWVNPWAERHGLPAAA